MVKKVRRVVGWCLLPPRHARRTAPPRSGTKVAGRDHGALYPPCPTHRARDRGGSSRPRVRVHEECTIYNRIYDTYMWGPARYLRSCTRLPSHPCRIYRRERHYDRRPQSRRDHPLNLSILLSGGKETNQDFLSSGERTGKSPAPNPAVPPLGNVVFGRVRLSRGAAPRPSPS